MSLRDTNIRFVPGGERQSWDGPPRSPRLSLGDPGGKAGDSPASPRIPKNKAPM